MFCSSSKSSENRTTEVERINVNFCFKLVGPLKEMHVMLVHVFGDQALSMK